MGRSPIAVEVTIDWTADAAAYAVLLVRAARAPDQVVLDEELEVTGAQVEEGPARRDGARPLRIHARRAGPVRLGYRARVDVDGRERASTGAGRAPPTAAELPFPELEWLLPSRYCPSDALAPTAAAELGDLPRTAALPGLVADWVNERIAYRAGTSDALTTAQETLLRREGVCRDMAHLCVALLRALDVPARMVAGYAAGLEPPDFHALVEVLGGRGWRMLDASRLAEVESIVRIASGRDAADVAWSSGDPALRLEELRVGARREA